MTDVPAAGPKPEPVQPAQAAAFAAAWIFGFLILRIFAVSGYDWDTAFVVSTTLRIDDGMSLLFGSLMAGQLLTAVLLVCVLPLLLAGVVWAQRAHRPVLMLLAALALILMVALTVSSRFWWLPVAIAVAFGLVALTRRLAAGNGLRRATKIAVGSVGWIAPVALLLVAALVPTPWVPLEQIQTTDGQISGYVLSVDSGFLNVLTDEHEFLILISNEVISRD